MQVPVLPIILVLMSWLSFSDPQMPRMNLATPRVGQAIELANYLMRLEDRGPSIRKECRMLTSRELERIFDALQRAKRDTRLRPNVLDCFAFLHSHPDVNAGAHGGTAFLPFHRVYLYLYEKLLRIYEPSISLCYWDSTLEPEEHEDSETWGTNLFGTSRGLITAGFAANWLTPLGPLIREVAARGRTLTEDDIENVLSKNRIGEISFPNGRMAENVEELHNDVHLYVGGLMGQIESAAYDPIFWFHHTYVDCLFERFRQKQNRTQQPKVDPQRDWPKDFGDEENAPFGPMRLGALRNIDGENNFFSEYMTCEPVPECRRDRDCGRFMNCNTRERRCVSNTRRSTQQGGSMFGGMFSMGQNSFNGMFQNGRFNPQGNQGFNQRNNGPMGFPSFLNQNQGPGNFPGMGFSGQNPQSQRPQGFFPGMGGQGNQQGFPQMPGMGGSQMSGMGGSQIQGMGGPQMPGMGGSQMPGMGGPQMPGMGGPQMPGMGGPQMPGMGGPQMPGMGGPQMPGMGGSQMPGMGGPQMPGMGGPQMPGMGGPQMPGMGGPQMPGMGGPQMPGMGGPQMPGMGGLQMPNFGGQGQSQMPNFPGLPNFGGRGQTPNQGMPNFGGGGFQMGK